MEKHALKRRKLDHPSAQTHDGKEDAFESENSSFGSLSGSDSGEGESHKPIGKPSDGTAKPRVARAKPKKVPTGDMYNSDLFQIQVGELLSAVQPNHDRQMARVEKTLRKLKQVIEDISLRQPLPVHNFTYPTVRFN